MQLCEVEILCGFLLKILYYLVPCVIGSFLGSIIKYVRNPSMYPIRISRIFIYTMLPSIALAATDQLLRSFELINTEFRIGLAIFCGVVGEELTQTLSTIRGILQITFNIRNLMANIESAKLDLSDPEKDMKESKKEDENTKSTSSKKKSKK